MKTTAEIAQDIRDLGVTDEARVADLAATIEAELPLYPAMTYSDILTRAVSFSNDRLRRSRGVQRKLSEADLDEIMEDMGHFVHYGRPADPSRY